MSWHFSRTDQFGNSHLILRSAAWSNKVLSILHFPYINPPLARRNPLSTMICSSCRQTLLSRLPGRIISPPPIRYTSSAPSTSPSPRQAPPDIAIPTAKTTPSATSSNTPGISQPLSTRMLPSTSSASRPNQAKPSKEQKLVGSLPGGTLLQGLGYLKAKPTVLAQEDDEYPDWLWTLLVPESGAGMKGGKSAADVAGIYLHIALLWGSHGLTLNPLSSATKSRP